MSPSRSITAPIKKARSVPVPTSLTLYGRAAGMCEMPGCFADLTAHHLTHAAGNYGEQGHIFAFSERGPRGGDPGRPVDVHVIENLILVCPACHKLVDTAPLDYPVEVLRQYKEAHESRVRHVTRLDESFRTAVLQLKSRIGGDPVDIPLADLSRAVAPRYPKDRKGCVIDISTIDDRDPAFMSLAARKISSEVDRFYAPGMDADAALHVSVFALAPMPLLVHLGFHLSNKIDTDFYQKHRAGGWAWTEDGPAVSYAERTLRQGSDPTKVALILSLSGRIDASRVPAMQDPAFTVREIALDGTEPHPGFLRRRADLNAFGEKYRSCLASIVATQPDAKELHLFPAVPAPVAIRCGFDVLKKVQPDLVVWDDDKLAGWSKKLEIRYSL